MAHILIVDDSATEVKIITKMLKRKKHQISEASSGEEGIKKVIELQPDLVLMDVIMPGKLNGYQATRHLTETPETKSIPVVIVSSLDTENDRMWGKLMGAAGYLAKPFKSKSLLEIINKLLAN